MEQVTDKVAVITGGNSGIGYAAAKVLSQHGAQVIITGRRKAAIEKAASELNVTGLLADQANLSDIDNLVAEIKKRYGKVDILLINAGITRFALIESTTEQVFDEVMDVNFKGAYFMLSKLIPVLNDHASVVFLSSTSATISPQSASVYAASKAAINAVMKVASLELAPRKIRVNAVSPGPVATEMMEKIGLNPELEQQLMDSIPLSRLGEVNEVAELILFLSGNKAGFITGSNFLIDGGQSV